MIRMKKFTWFFTFSLILVMALNVVVTACGPGNSGSSASGQTKLTMGTSADYPPYEFRDTSQGDEIIGFDVDIAKSITQQLGYELEIKDMDFNGLIPALQSGRVDFVMAGMTPTEERKKNIDFSTIYYEAKNTLVAKKGKNYQTLDQLAGKIVGVQLGTIQEKEVKTATEKISTLQIKPLNRIPEIIQELKAGRIEAAVIEDTVAKGYIANNPDLEFNTIPNSEEAGSAIAFPKGSDKVAKFNEALQTMKDSGELDKLVKKWFEDYQPKQ